MHNDHPKVPPTKENFEADHQDKVKLNEEFARFKKLVDDAAKTSPDVQKLLVPLDNLGKAVIKAAFGRHFYEDDYKSR
jgi:hypothetical protein